MVEYRDLSDTEDKGLWENEERVVGMGRGEETPQRGWCLGSVLKDESELDGWSHERITFPAKRQRWWTSKQEESRSALGWGPSPALTTGKPASPWCSARSHYCGALGKP